MSTSSKKDVAGVSSAFVAGVASEFKVVKKALLVMFGCCFVLTTVIIVGLKVTGYEDTDEFKDSRNCFLTYGTPLGFDEKIAEQLRDPDSLKMGATTITGTDSAGVTTFDTEIRAKNGFGGYTVEIVHGTMAPHCVSRVIGMDQA